MPNFNLGSLNTWKPLAIGEILDLDTPAAGFRSVAFDVIASGVVTVHAVSGDDYWIVGHGEGEINIKFAIDRSVGVVAVGDASTDVFIRTQLDTPVIPESVEASYTTIEPRPSGPSEDLRRMMQMVKVNAMRREHELEVARNLERASTQAEIDALKARIETALPPAAPVGGDKGAEE